MPRSPEHQTLTLRELNRALLARQLLLRRVRLAPAAAIERLGALQAQWPAAPYVALWSRLAGMVAARWGARVTGRTAVLAIAPFRRLSGTDRTAITAEGAELIRFIHPDAGAHEVRFVSAAGLPLTNLALRP